MTIGITIAIIRTIYGMTNKEVDTTRVEKAR